MSAEIIPSLLDRLTSSDPTGPPEPLESLNMSYDDYVASVIRDLDWLLNTRALSNETRITLFDYERGQLVPWPNGLRQPGDEARLGDYPQASDSVIGYGTGEPGLEGTPATSEESCARLKAAFVEAIRRFEPRIDPQSLRIEDLAEQDAKNPDQRRPFPCARFKITARLCLLRSEISIATSFDITASKFHLCEVGHGS